MHRRRAAIVSADVVGYGPLIRDDEAGTRLAPCLAAGSAIC